MRNQVIKNGGTKYCKRCLNHFGSKALLERHKRYCNNHEAVALEKDSVLKFVSHNRKISVPFVGFVDFESILRKYPRANPIQKIVAL